MAALVLVTGLLVFTGFWLDRREAVRAPPGASGTAAAPVTAPGTASAAARPATERSAKAASAGSTVAAAPTTPATGVPLPKGYRALPYLTANRQLVFAKAQKVLQPGLAYAAVLVTTKGDITIQLLRQDAPVTVNNFVFLALHRFYNGVPFHRVIAGFMAQTGDPTGTGTGGPGYTFPDEIAKRLHFDKSGVVAMANAGPNTNGSQFFITFGPTPWLDGHYNIFGQVVTGSSVLGKLQRIDPQHPEAVVALTDTLGQLADKGVKLAGKTSDTVGQTLAGKLGAPPVAGQSFDIGDHRAVVGTANGKPAVAFYPKPDVLMRVVIAVKQAG